MPSSWILSWGEAVKVDKWKSLLYLIWYDDLGWWSSSVTSGINTRKLESLSVCKLEDHPVPRLCRRGQRLHIKPLPSSERHTFKAWKWTAFHPWKVHQMLLQPLWKACRFFSNPEPSPDFTDLHSELVSYPSCEESTSQRGRKTLQ